MSCLHLTLDSTFINKLNYFAALYHFKVNNRQLGKCELKVLEKCFTTKINSLWHELTNRIFCH